MMADLTRNLPNLRQEALEVLADQVWQLDQADLPVMLVQVVQGFLCPCLYPCLYPCLCPCLCRCHHLYLCLCLCPFLCPCLCRCHPLFPFRCLFLFLCLFL